MELQTEEKKEIGENKFNPYLHLFYGWIIYYLSLRPINRTLAWIIDKISHNFIDIFGVVFVNIVVPILLIVRWVNSKGIARKQACYQLIGYIISDIIFILHIYNTWLNYSRIMKNGL